MNEALNLAVVQTELDGVFYQEFNRTEAPGTATALTAEIFKPIVIEHKNYIEETFGGVGMWDAIGEQATVPTDTALVQNKKTTNVLDFAKGIEISKDFFDDNMFGTYSRMVSDLAEKGRVTRDMNAFKVFRNAFTTQLTADGAAWISASHTLIKGGTVSNLVTGALTPTTFNNAIVALQIQKDQSNVILGGKAEMLVVPPALFVTATQITQSALVSDSGNNAINVFRSAYGIVVYTSPYISAAAGGSDTAWFLLTRNHGIRRVVRQGIQTNLRDWSYSNNRTYFYQANFREEVDTIDYCGAVASTGL
jgi:hypothetical protein